MAKEQNLPVAVAEQFPILNPERISEQALVMKENLEAFGGSMSIMDFAIIKTPKAPVSFWERENVYGEKETTPELQIIPFKILPARLF